MVAFSSFFTFLKGGSLSPPASRSLLSSSSQSRHAGCSSTASRMKDTAHHQDIFATNSLREKEARSTLRNIARSNGRSQEIDVMKMSNKGDHYMFLWYPAPALGCFKKDTLKKNETFTPARNWGVPRKFISRRKC